MPAVTVRSRPNGLPIATTGSPTCDGVGVAERSGVSAPGLASTLSTAMSVEGSVPTSVAFRLSSFEKLTRIESAPSNDVVVRDDVALLVEARSRSRARLRN